MIDAAAEGRMIGLEKEDGSSFQSSPDTKFIYLDADGNETSYEKFKEYYLANEKSYTLPSRVVGEDVVFSLQKVRALEKDIIGQTLPTLTYPDINGKEVKIIDGETPFLICLWFVGCGACIEELKVLNYISREFPDLKIVALTHDESSEVKKFMEDGKFKWNNITIVPDYKKEYHPIIQSTIFPTSVLVSKEGVIQGMYGSIRQMIVDMDAISAK